MAHIPLAGAGLNLEPQGIVGNEEMDLLWPEWGLTRHLLLKPRLPEAKACRVEAGSQKILRLQEPGEKGAWPTQGRKTPPPELGASSFVPCPRLDFLEGSATVGLCGHRGQAAPGFSWKGVRGLTCRKAAVLLQCPVCVWQRVRGAKSAGGPCVPRQGSSSLLQKEFHVLSGLQEGTPGFEQLSK